MVDLRSAINLLRSGALSEAKEQFLACSAKAPEKIESQLYLAHIADIECDWSNRKERIKALAERYNQACSDVKTTPNFPICYLPFDISDELLVKQASIKAKKYQNIESLKLVNKKKEKVRVGIVSLDFRSHSNGVDLSPVFSSCREGGLELYGYSFSDNPSATKSLSNIRKLFDNFKELGNLSYKEVANLIQLDSLDMLIDTTRHIENSPEELFYYKPAPIQITAWGYGPSTGSRIFDYFIADKVLAPELENEIYSEIILRLNQYIPISLNSDILFSNSNLKNGNLTFGAFGASYKLRPELFDIWMEILVSTPDSILLIIIDSEAAKKNLCSRFKDKGLNTKRLLFSGRLDPREFSNFLKEKIDIVLDNPILGGSFALVEALKLGIPVITYEADGFSGRGSASLESALGFEAFIGTDLFDYKRIALELASTDAILTKPMKCEENYATLLRQLLTGK